MSIALANIKMSGLKFYKAIFSNESNKTISERSRLDVNHTTSKTAVRHSGGYNDDALGAVDRRIKCETCHATKELCYGHHGSYELRYPIIQQILMSELLNVLRVICHNCFKTRAMFPDKNIKKLATSKTICSHCQTNAAEVTKNKMGTGVMVTYKGGKKHQMSNKRIYKILRSIPFTDVKALGLDSKIDCFLLKRVDIIPTSARVEIQRAGKQSLGPDITIAYKHLIESNEALNLDMVAVDAPELLQKIDEMTAQFYFGTVGVPGHPSQNLALSLKNKEGLVRSRLMGRRVSHISRSVITGDANLAPQEVGISVNIANSICIQERVTEHNVTLLRFLVANGDHWPGAKYVSVKTGSLDHLGHPIMKKIRIYESNKASLSISPGDVVFRHLLNGDLAMLNRQPTLMAQSMAGMQIKISHSSFTITLNPGSCAPFNADFDGDNMNLSFGTTTGALNELRMTSMFNRWTENHQSISFTLGLFQDTIVGGAMFSLQEGIPAHIARKICADPEIFNAGSGTALRGTGDDHAAGSWGTGNLEETAGETPEGKPLPSKRKAKSIPVRETSAATFSGRELMSKIIPSNVNMSKKSSLEGKPVEIVNGKILSGVLDKSNAGQSVEGSLFHEISIANGPDVSLAVLSNFQEMIKRFQGYYTVSTIGIKDILFPYQGIREVRDLVKERVAMVENLYMDAYNGRLAIPAGKTLEETIEEREFGLMNTSSEVGKIVMSHLDRIKNNIIRLIVTGSKGNMSAATTIFGSVGYISIDGGRIPHNMGNRCYLASPNFPIDPVYKGCVLNSFRIGISNREIFATATDARESFISNALNTQTAGTFTKNLNKCMDPMMVDYFYGIITNKKIVQTLVYDFGFALHRLVKVKVQALAYKTIEEFKKVYGINDSGIAEHPLLQEWLSIRKAFVKHNLNPTTETVDLPFDIAREINNAVNNFKKLRGEKLTTSTVELRINKVITEIDKIFFNRTRLIEPTADMLAALRIIKFSLMTELQVSRLEVHKIGDKLLDIILSGIIPSLTKALVSPTEAIGVLLSFIMGEPLTQYSLDSKHRSGGAGGQNLDAMVRIKELFACKPAVGTLRSGKMSPSMQLPLMFIHLHEQDIPNINKYTQELEMSSLRAITKRVEILFEKKNQSKAYPKENIKTDTSKVKLVNSGFINWCIRFEIDNKSFIEGGYDINDVINNIAAEEPNLVVESVEIGDLRCIRIYIKEINFNSVAGEIKRYRKEKIPVDLIRNKPMLLFNPLSETLLGIRIRGMQNIIRASVDEKKEISIDTSTGEIVERKIPYIVLVGFNYNVLFEEYVDERKSWTNSIMDTNNIYGLSKARHRLVEELYNTIPKYAKQHCTVLADQMASTGRITTIYRNGIIARDKKNIMLLAYERSPFKTFSDAASKNVTQIISGPTPSVMVGQKVDAGTGRVVLVARD